MSNKSEIRVLHVLPSLTCAGGMISVVKNYQQYIDDYVIGFDYLYFSEVEDSIGPELEARGSRTWHVPFGAPLIEFFKNHPHEFHIVHCHPIFSSQFIGPLAKKYGAKRVIAHSHSTMFSDKRASAIRNSLLSWFVGVGATDYIACSEGARKLLRWHGRDAMILHNAVNPEEFAFKEVCRSRIRGHLGIPKEATVFGTVARLAPEKNLELLLRMAAKLRLRSRDCYFVIVGGGPLEKDLKNLSISLGVDDRVIFTGPRSNVADFYSAFDCFCLPSVFEGLPISVVEAQAAGLPCLLSDSITREVDYWKCKFLPIDSLDKWVDEAEAIRIEANRIVDPGVVEQAGYDIRHEANRLVEYYQRLMKTCR